MIRHRLRAVRTVLVIGITAFAIAAVPSAAAQGAPEVPWWQQLQGPDGPTQALLIQNVQRTASSVFDPTLPPIPVDQWLWVTLAPFAEFQRRSFVEWQVSFCLDPQKPIPSVAPELCAEGTIAVSAERHVRMVVAVADAVRNRATGRAHWRPTSPSLRDVYIERMNGLRRIDSLEVPALAALPVLINIPFEQWPAASFESTVSWDPPNPTPGAKVRFSLSVRNTSTRSVDRVWISILISPCCAHTEVRHEWFPPIAAGQSVRVEVDVPLPEGMAMAMVTAKAWQGDKRVRESHPNAEPTFAAVGYPPRPH